eukprot:912567-Prymnesium_polylepis.1
MVQKRHGSKGERQAEVDGGRVAKKLEAKVVEAGWWLVAPLKEHTGDGAAQIDTGLVKLAIELFRSCNWPRLDGDSHPLAREVNDAEDAGLSCDYCVLA